MGKYQSVFCRKEIKYLMDEAQFRAFSEVLEQYTVPDAFYASQIHNLYYDTPDFLMIRRSLLKPKYKEKLRLRCYGVPGRDSESFVEIKKKFNGVVYKRRESLPYGQALDYLAGKGPGGDSQIFHELDWMLAYYQELAPAMYLSYSRHSRKGIDDPQLRMTIDEDILWRTTSLDLSLGAFGQPILEPGQRLMEIKIHDAMPLWLAEALSELQIFPTSFSKYGTAYKNWLSQGQKRLEVKKYA